MSSVTTLSINLSVFLVALAIMQCVAFLCYEKKIIWILADYFWVGLASLGILAATDAARRYEAPLHLEITRAHLQGILNISYSHIGFYSDYYRNMPYENWQINKDRIPTYKQAGAWFHDASKVVEGSIEEIAKFIDSYSVLSSDPEIQRYQKTAIRLLESRKKDLNEIALLEEAKQMSPYEALRLYVTPWLLAIALAIRLGKVTAEFLLFKQRQRSA